jgi:hypothetical protein
MLWIRWTEVFQAAAIWAAVVISITCIILAAMG